MKRDTKRTLEFCERMDGKPIDTLSAILIGAVASRVGKDDRVLYELLEHYFDEQDE